MNTVGPLNNRQETYPYFQLPFCQGPQSVQHHHETLGEALQGMDLVHSGIPISFLGEYFFLKKGAKLCITRSDSFKFFVCAETKANEPYCEKTLDEKDIDVLRYAVDNQYWYTMFIGKIDFACPKKKTT